VVARARRSQAAVTKQTTGVTAHGLPVHSFQSLLADLATLARNTIVTAITPDYPLTVLTRPTPVQHKAFELLGVGVEPVTMHGFRGSSLYYKYLRLFKEGNSV
jgi:hypothetical protein